LKSVNIEHNPGGSLGDLAFPAPDFATRGELKEWLFRFKGYDVSNNLVSTRWVKGRKVAELGCGHGLLTTILSESASEVDAYDVDAKALTYAEKIRLRYQLRNVRFIQFDGNTTGAPADSYDCIVSSDVLEHVRDPAGYLGEAKRILRPGGVLVLTTPNGLIANKDDVIVKLHSKYHITEYFPEEVADMLKGMGMEVSQVIACKKTQGGLRVHANPLRRRVIRALHSVHLLGIASRLRQYAYARVGRGSDSIWDYTWSETTIINITAKNCDSFAIIATRTSSVDGRFSVNQVTS
jgi:2-polyprenyl-3-methyl-5-hydroxy-6-metoxy-1,4-benzoquinol methylase